MGGQIVVHSFRLVFRNLRDALKVSIGPYAIWVVLAVVIMGAAGVSLSTLLEGGAPTVPDSGHGMAGQAFASLLVMLALLFISSWVAVAWHRFVLLEEYPGILPALGGRPVGSYIARAIKLALLLIVIAIPVMFILGLLVVPLFGGPDGMATTAALVLSIIMGTFLTWLSIRFGLVLPAISVGKPMTFRESWRASAPLSTPILSAVLILMVLSILVTEVLRLVLGGTFIFGPLGLVVNWISIMVGLSILTTVYGHTVEGRAID